MVVYTAAMDAVDIHDRIKHKLTAYRPNEASIALIRATPLLLLLGVSGAGKGTITSELIKKGTYHYIISHTTRKPRSNNGIQEQDGREYHFISLLDAERMLDNGEYVEAKMYSGNVYGTSVAEVSLAHDSHQIAVADIEVQGMAEYIAIDPYVKTVFILPTNYEEWQARIVKRSNGQIDSEDYTRRMATARREIEYALQEPKFVFVVNDSLTDAVAAIDRIATSEINIDDFRDARHVAEELVRQLHSKHPA